MKIRTAILFAIVAVLLIGSQASARSGIPLAGYVVKPGAASGGGYRLASQAGVTNGEGYRLVAPLSPAGTGTPCCCNYLPCVLHN